MISLWCDANGSPGVSSWALLTAAACQAGQTRVLVEADRDGGSVSSRLMTGTSPGLPELLTAASRRVGERLELAEVSHRVDEDTYLVPSSPFASEVRTLLQADAGALLSGALLGDERWWFVDVGRHALSDSLVNLAGSAHVAVVVTRAETEYLMAAKPLVAWFPRSVVLVVGKPRHSKVELLEWFDSPVHIVTGESVVDVAAGCFANRKLRRTRAFREAREVSELVAQVGLGGAVHHGPE